VTVEIAVIIPTRNRDSLAIAAARSLLGQGVEIFVSDNSDVPGSVRGFCEAQDGVHYLRPSSVLPMADHWDWAVRQAMSLSRATHFSVHYDRKLSIPGLWPALAAAAAASPDLLTTFMYDNVLAYPPPRRVWQVPWTGKIYSVSAKRLRALIAGGEVHAIANVLPLLSNCIAPREVLEGMIARFGSICRGAAPDSAFMARYLALHDRCLHFDRSLAVMYGSERSTGMGYLRGAGGDFADFRRIYGDGAWLEDAPVPGVSLGFNLMFHDYEMVRRETGELLPRINRQAVLDTLATDLRWLADPEEKARLMQVLRDHGWSGREPQPFAEPGAPRTAYHHAMLLGARFLRIAPKSLNGVSFRDDSTALAFALRYPRRRQGYAEHIALAEPVELT
jgi:hypothetical protein